MYVSLADSLPTGQEPKDQKAWLKIQQLCKSKNLSGLPGNPQMTE